MSDFVRFDEEIEVKPLEADAKRHKFSATMPVKLESPKKVNVGDEVWVRSNGRDFKAKVVSLNDEQEFPTIGILEV